MGFHMRAIVDGPINAQVELPTPYGLPHLGRSSVVGPVAHKAFLVFTKSAQALLPDKCHF
jgi:hypothetical protein